MNALAVQSDGKILIGGSFDTVADICRTNIARLNPDGSLDTSFIASTSLTDSFGNSAHVSTFALLSNGQIVVAGNFAAVDGTNMNNLARLYPNGSLDHSFNSFGGIGLTNQVADQYGNPMSAVLGAMVVQTDGKIIIGGTFDSVNGVGRTNLARLNPDGSLDTNFLAGTELIVHCFDEFGNPFTTAASVSALALDPDGTIVVGGIFATLDGADRASIARLNWNGSLDTNFFVGDGVENSDNPGTVRSIFVQPDGTMMIAGQFTSVHGTGRNGLARLNSDGSLDTGFDLVEDRTIDAVAIEPDGSLFAAEFMPGMCSRFYSPTVQF